VLGSIHAFSVFIAPLEAGFGAPRSAVSMSYSLALAALTISVLLGPRLYGRWPASIVMLIACGGAALGAGIAALAGSLPMVWLGYSLVFGAANGLGYGFGLQMAAQVNPGREGLAMGVVTAAYAFGAVFSPALFERAVSIGGFAFAMWVLGAALIATGLLSAGLMHKARARFQGTPALAGIGPVAAPARFQALLWLGYFGGVLAGLMVIGHAAGIAASFRPGMAAWVAPAVIAGCNLCGSLVAGRLADRVSLGALLGSLALLTSFALLGLAASSGEASGLLMAFGIIGFAYGGTIAAYPAAIAKLFGMRASAFLYGRIFTAWGAAGLLGPWFAGRLFDLGSDYRIALLTAAGVALGSVIAVVLLFRQARPLPG
jgi:MFS family permease